MSSSRKSAMLTFNSVLGMRGLIILGAGLWGKVAQGGGKELLLGSCW